MKKTKKVLSLFLCLLLMVTVAPTGMLSASAATWDRTDFSVDFNYEYSTPAEAMKQTRKATVVENNDKDGEIVWKHASKITDQDNNTVNLGFMTYVIPRDNDLRYLLTSENPDDKYIVLDCDCKTTTGYDSDGSIVIRSDKVIDLNGYRIVWKDIRNKHDTHNERKENYSQSTGSEGFQEIFFSIENGATVTIIDSSETDTKAGTGEIYYDAFMVNPFSFNLRKYTTRDLFWVNDGNLIVYGGKLVAGRSKQHSSEEDTGFFDDLTTVIGDAVCLATDVAGYATGISSAVGKLEDISFNAKTALEELKKSGAGKDDDGQTAVSSADSEKNQSIGATDKKDGTGSVEETIKDNPVSTEGRNQTVNEKQGEKDKKTDTQTDNKANAKGTAKEYDGNSKIAEAKNAVVNAAVNKDKITSMVSSAAKLGKSIKSLFVSDCDCFVTQSLLGTAVHVGNKGTFVSYGGHYIGYGMTPNIRNAVIEVTKKGKAYIYGGKFEGKCGANIFNITEAIGNASITKTQYLATDDADIDDIVNNAVTVQIKPEETGGLKILDLNDDGTLIDTSNITVRGGTFVNSFEYNMVGLHEPKNPGGTDHDGENMTLFPGTSGCVNLGVESFDEDFIRDGRIQIVDNYGDGALVLMDEEKQKNENSDGTEQSVYHYRLFCQDDELRSKRYLTVYPNQDVQANSTYSFALQTRYNNTDSTSYDDQSKAWSGSTSENDGILSQDELYFTFPIDGNTSEKYYVVPFLSDTDPYGEDLEASDVWYYKTPTNQSNKKLTPFTDELTSIWGSRDGKSGYHFSEKDTGKKWEDGDYEDALDKNSIYYEHSTRSYASTIKWFTYKIYRVDPLTRESISESSVYGVDEPLKKVVYGCSNDSIRCRLPLTELGIDYKPGEMYRIVLSVDEYLQYGETAQNNKNLSTASCSSSIVFMCYSINEQKVEDDHYVEDPTPLQWITEPAAGQYATVSIVNGKAGQVDLNTRKIFDVYYQWYAVNENGGEDELIAGTTNIYTGYDLNALKNHKIESFKPDSDIYDYKNTVNPSDKSTVGYGSNGLPLNTKEWSVDMLHMYTESDTSKAALTKNLSEKLTLGNNKAFATNTDSCYIPEEYEGRTIYCKCTVVNTFWPKNFDHIQVFYTHKVTLPEVINPIKANLTVKYSGNYASPDNQAKISIDSIENLRLNKGEYITKIKYYAVGTSHNLELTKNNLCVKSPSDVPVVTFPNDFLRGSLTAEKLNGFENVRIFALIRTNLREEVYYTNTVIADYEIAAEGYSFTKSNYYMHGDAYYVTDTDAAQKLYASVVPEYATIGNAFVEGSSFTTTDKDVATLNTLGKLVLGGKAGSTTITLINPDKTTQSVKVVVPIKEVKIGGIDAPVIGKALDISATVDDDAPYTVKKVYWTENSSGTALKAGTVATYFKNYHCHIVVTPNDGCDFDMEFSSSYPYSKVDYTVDFTNGESISKTAYPEAVGGKNTFEIDYTFSAVSNPGDDVIGTIMINFPTENIKQGDSVEQWLEQTEIICAAQDALDITLRPALTGQAADIFAAYGYSGSAEKCTVFIKGMQNGINAELKIPNELSDKISFADTLTVLVNGEEQEAVITKVNSAKRIITVSDAYEVADGETIKPISAKPYEKSNINIAVGQTVNIWDYIYFEDGTSRYNSKPQYEYIQNEGYFELDCETGAVTGLKTTGYWEQQIQLSVYHDITGTGERSMKQYYTFDVKVYETEDDIPNSEAATPYNIDIEILSPEGESIYTGVTDTELLDIPEQTGMFVSEIVSSDENIRFTFDKGIDRPIMSGTADSDLDLTVYTAPAEIKINIGANEIYTDNLGATGLLYSVDGMVWTTASNITGLSPETEYTLYYKQGYCGKVYSKTFTTAKYSYGVVSGVPITENNLGNLNEDGWHYDIESKTLTLKNFKIKGKSTVVFTEFFYDSILNVDAVIGLFTGGTLKLLGDNSIESNAWITLYSGAELKITGNGNLLIDGSVSPVQADGDIDLDYSGLLTVQGCYNDVFTAVDSSITYKNGDILYLGSLWGSSAYGGKFHSGTNFNIGNTVHNVKYYVYDEEENGAINKSNVLTSDKLIEIDISEFYSASKQNNKIIYIQAQHSCTNKAESEAYLKSGDCTKGCTYYKSCLCGYTDKSVTFKGSGGGHNLQSFEGKAATCLTDGYEAYGICTKCGYSTFKTIYATGHSYEHFTAKEPTCTKAGWGTYDICKYCNSSTKTEIPMTGHTLVSYNAKAPTCSGTGYNAYEKCTACDYTTYAEIGKLPHESTYEIITEQPTCSEKGTKEIRCTKCEETVSTLSVAALPHTEAVKNAYAATCTAEGHTGVIYCTVCNTIIDNGYTIQPLGHTWGTAKTTTAATCTKEGVKTAKCTRKGCTATKTEKLAKLTHTYKTVVSPATSSKDGKIQNKCSVCGSVKSTTAIAKIKSVTLAKTSTVYSGKAQKIAVTVKDGKGKTVDAKYYTVSYKNNTGVGKATVTVKFKGNYSGTKTLNFNIVPKGTTVSKVTSTKKGTADVTVKKQTTQTTGYEIQYSTSKDFKASKTVKITSAKTLSKSITKLSSSKTYYFRVRTYKTVSKVDYTSAWSTSVKVKIK